MILFLPYSQVSNTSENSPFPLASPPQNTSTPVEKARSKSLTVDCRKQTSPTLLLPYAVENEDTHSQSLHDPCIVKSSPLRPSSGRHSTCLIQDYNNIYVHIGQQVLLKKWFMVWRAPLS